MSVAIDVEVRGLQRLQDRLLLLERDDWTEMLEEVGGVVEAQTRLRISEQKASPEGQDWKPWSERYEKTRHSGHSLLENEGDLVDSIQSLITGDELQVGTNLVYGATHQFGDKRLAFGRVEVTIPARPFLGLSQDNMDEIVEVIDSFLDDLTRGRRR